MSAKTEKIREQINEDDEELEIVRSSRSNRRSAAAPQTPNHHMDDDEDFMEGEYMEQTPSAIGGSNRSKKTRFGSTDAHGNRLSNMPGEERPSLTSVAPYDDTADTMIRKVEKVAASAKPKARTPKKTEEKVGGNEHNLDRANALGAITKANEELL